MSALGQVDDLGISTIGMRRYGYSMTGCAVKPIHLAMLLARITSAQSFISRLSNALAASGVSSLGGYSSMPPSAKVLRTLGSASAARNAVLSLLTIGRGVPAGASSMCQKSISRFL